MRYKTNQRNNKILLCPKSISSEDPSYSREPEDVEPIAQLPQRINIMDNFEVSLNTPWSNSETGTQCQVVTHLGNAPGWGSRLLASNGQRQKERSGGEVLGR